jgi:hypothetical protein
MYLREIGWDGMVWIGLKWLIIETGGRLLWTRYWTFGFHKMLGSSWVAEQLVAPQEGLSSVSKYYVLLSDFKAKFHTRTPWSVGLLSVVIVLCG